MKKKVNKVFKKNNDNIEICIWLWVILLLWVRILVLFLNFALAKRFVFVTLFLRDPALLLYPIFNCKDENPLTFYSSSALCTRSSQSKLSTTAGIDSQSGHYHWSNSWQILPRRMSRGDKLPYYQSPLRRRRMRRYVCIPLHLIYLFCTFEERERKSVWERERESEKEKSL